MISLMEMATNEQDGIDRGYLKDLIDIFKRGTDYMVGLSTPSTPKKDPEPPEEIPPPDESDDIPF